MHPDNIALGWSIWRNDDLTAFEKAVAICLIYHRNALTGMCNPAQKLMASQTGWGLRTVERAIHGLKHKGIIQGKRTNRTAQWTFLI